MCTGLDVVPKPRVSVVAFQVELVYFSRAFQLEYLAGEQERERQRERERERDRERERERERER